MMNTIDDLLYVLLYIIVVCVVSYIVIWLLMCLFLCCIGIVTLKYKYDEKKRRGTLSTSGQTYRTFGV